LFDSLDSGARVGLDPTVHSAYAVNRMSDWLKQKTEAGGKELHIQLMDNNPVDHIWAQDEISPRPQKPNGPVRIHELQFAGVSVGDKLTRIRLALDPSIDPNNPETPKAGAQSVADALVSASLDEIAYIFNIRGKDVPCNTVTVAYSMVTQKEALLFIDEVSLRVCLFLVVSCFM